MEELVIPATSTSWRQGNANSLLPLHPSTLTTLGHSSSILFTFINMHKFYLLLKTNECTNLLQDELRLLRERWNVHRFSNPTFAWASISKEEEDSTEDVEHVEKSGSNAKERHDHGSIRRLIVQRSLTQYQDEQDLQMALKLSEEEAGSTRNGQF